MSPPVSKEEIEMARSVLQWVRRTPEEHKADRARLEADTRSLKANWEKAQKRKR